MLYEVTRALSPMELSAMTAISEAGDRSVSLLRVVMTDNGPARVIELMPTGKPGSGLVNINLRDLQDDVVDQVVQHKGFLGTHRLEFLGAEYRLHIVAGPDEKPVKRKPASHAADTPAPKLNPEERAARAKEYLRHHGQLCINCGKPGIIKGVVIGNFVQVRCPACRYTWHDRVWIVAPDGGRYEDLSDESGSKHRTNGSDQRKRKTRRGCGSAV